jgi:glutaconate CoA-transferase, subunit A
MSKLLSVSDAISEFVVDGCSVAMGLQLEEKIPFAAAHEIMRQHKRDLTLIGPISDILFDQVTAAGCVSRVIAAWVGNAMMGSAYNFRRAVESGSIQVTNMSNFTLALALQAGALGVPFLPARTALGTDTAKGNPLFGEVQSPFDPPEKLLAVHALNPDVTIIHVPRADADGNAHSWGSFGVMLEAIKAAKRVIVVAEQVVSSDVITSDPNRTVVPGFLVNAVVECPLGAHPSPVQGYYNRDDAFFSEYHEQTKTPEHAKAWLERWVFDCSDREAYLQQVGAGRIAGLMVKNHAPAAMADFGY